MRKKRIIIISSAAVLILGLVMIIIFMLGRSTTLQFSLVDKVSGAWVYNSTIRLQGMVIRGFKKTDFLFTGLKPGQSQLEISAPHYLGISIPVNIKKGKNQLKEPIILTGYAIPDLQYFYIFERYKEDQWIMEIRFAGSDNQAIEDHPCLDLRLFCQISEQVTLADNTPGRGQLIFSGIADWQWDPDPGKTYRYMASIPAEKVTQAADQHYFVFDYLLLIPDARKISTAELNKVADQAADLIHTLDQLTAYLDSFKGQLSYFIKTKFEVEQEGGVL